MSQSLARIFIRARWLFLLLINGFQSLGQMDTVTLTREQVLVFRDSVYMPNQDTVVVIPSDIKYSVRKNQYAKSEQFFDSLQTKSYKSAISKELFNFFITYRQPEDIFSNSAPIRSESFYEALKGKTIRSIDIIRVDIFEGSVSDTTRVAQTGFGKAANSIHKNTNRRVILSNVLFEEGDPVKPFQIADSERIIRALNYVEDARIVLVPDPEDLEVVDAIIIVKDRFPWSLGLDFSSFSKYKVGLNNRNIVGTGNQFGARYLYNSNKVQEKGYDITFASRNIGKSFIDFTAFGGKNYLREGGGVAVTKDFVSPEIKYGGELLVQRVKRYRDLIFADSVYQEDAPFSYNNFDFWLGRSWALPGRRNIGISGRYLTVDYDERPPVEPDSNQIFHNRQILLGSLHFSRLYYLKTKNILSFNITEDVPIGYLAEVIVGHDWGEFDDYNYLGFQLSGANFFDVGYFGASAELGAFYDANQTRNEILKLVGNYFSPLASLGRTFNRNFVTVNYFNSNDLTIPLAESLAFRDRFRGIDGNQLAGEDVINAGFESVFFLPWYLYGFQFAPYVFYDFGYVSESRSEEPFKEVFHALGPGIRIRNESLVFSTFQLQVAWFPNEPEDGSAIGVKISLSRPLVFGTFFTNKPEMVQLEVKNFRTPESLRDR